ncbi:hypothetical protein [Ornithinimicrobium kibberense]|uniref:hypothetical protein n=1 Tax=Ornithinimicrobium kibberense TaxID=282060 RepID=UPI003612068D
MVGAQTPPAVVTVSSPSWRPASSATSLESGCCWPGMPIRQSFSPRSTRLCCPSLRTVSISSRLRTASSASASSMHSWSAEAQRPPTTQLCARFSRTSDGWLPPVAHTSASQPAR